MKHLLILGAGTAGAMVANRARARLPRAEWNITVVDRETRHFYQPGYLFIPFGIYSGDDIVKPIEYPMPNGVELMRGDIEGIDTARSRVTLAGGRELEYDYLVVATGCSPRPGETEGLTGTDWGTRAFEFYTFDGALRLAEFLKTWQGGRLVIDVAEMPIKCPVAPVEFAFLADFWFTKRGMRDRVEIELATPLSGAFTRPMCSKVLGHFFKDKNIKLTTDYSIASVDPESHSIADWEDRRIAYDCLVIVPVNMGDDAIARSGMGDDLNFVPTHPNTLRSKKHENVFVVGDATDLPSSKAGSVAHFQSEILVDNVLRASKGHPLADEFDGHANCFIETGYGKAVLVDFSYDIEPLPGKYPLPVLGPFTLLSESYANHWGKMAFRWIYWNLLVKGRHIPVSNRMSMSGKIAPPDAAKATDERQ